MAEPHPREQDLLSDPDLLASVRRGLQQAAAGEVHDLGPEQEDVDGSPQAPQAEVREGGMPDVQAGEGGQGPGAPQAGT